MISTSNVKRYEAAAAALEPSLSDRDVDDLGLIYRRPGVGKTMWLEPYKSQTMKRNVRTTVFLVRALAIWTEASILKDLLAAVGQVPLKYRKEVMFDQLLEDLSQNSAVFLVDEIDSIAESRRRMAVLKDLHDVTFRDPHGRRAEGGRLVAPLRSFL